MDNGGFFAGGAPECPDADAFSRQGKRCVRVSAAGKEVIKDVRQCRDGLRLRAHERSVESFATPTPSLQFKRVAHAFTGTWFPQGLTFFLPKSRLSALPF